MKKKKILSPTKDRQQTEMPPEQATLRTVLLHPAAHLLLIILAGAAVYANTFSVPFVLDDVTSIYGNQLVRNFNLAFKPRMLGDLTFAVNYRFGGMEVAGYHLLNLLIHLLNGLLVYFLLSLLGKTPVFPSGRDVEARLLPLFTALLFVCHPLQTQAVTYISQRFASLATLFYLATLVIWLVARQAGEGKKRLLLFLGAFITALLAMATKEIAVTLPLTLLLLEFVFYGGPLRRLMVPVALFSLAAAMIPAAFFAASGVKGGLLQSLGRLATPTHVISRSDYLLTQLRVLATYLRLLVLPLGQNLDYDYPVEHTLFSLPLLSSLSLLLILLSGGVYLLHRGKRSGQPTLSLIGFGILWFFITLSVESSLIPLQDVIFEHRLYLPSVGLFTSFVAGMLALRHYQPLRTAAAWVVPVLSVVVLLLAAAAVARNEVWRDEVRLWEDVVSKSPAKARPHGSLARAYQKRGRYDDAVREFRAAIKLDGRDAANHNNLGTVLFMQKKWQVAVDSYREALRLDPANVKARYNLGSALIELGRYGEAETELREAVRLKPDYDAAHNSLGIVCARLQRIDEAQQEFSTALRLNSGNSAAAGNLKALSGRK